MIAAARCAAAADRAYPSSILFGEPRGWCRRGCRGDHRRGGQPPWRKFHMIETHSRSSRSPPGCAISGLQHAQQRWARTQSYSINSSARKSNVGGIVSPSAFGRFKVDNKLELCWLLDGKVSRPRALEYPVNVTGCAPMEIGITDGVAHEPTGVDKFSGRVDRPMRHASSSNRRSVGD